MTETFVNSNASILFIEEKPLNSDPALSERIHYHRLDSVDEWSIDGDLNTRRATIDD